jgi:hypothetical protein
MARASTERPSRRRLINPMHGDEFVLTSSRFGDEFVVTLRPDLDSDSAEACATQRRRRDSRLPWHHLPRRVADAHRRRESSSPEEERSPEGAPMNGRDSRAERRRNERRDQKAAKKQGREEVLGRWTPFEDAGDTITMNKGQHAVQLSATGFKKCFVNNRYTVMVRQAKPDPIFGRVIHLSIRRNDRSAARDWRDFQRIKNELVGPEVEAVEFFPAESRLVDAANQFHLWCFPDFRFTVGFSERDVRGPDGAMFGATQRPFEPLTYVNPETRQSIVDDGDLFGRRLLY